MGSSLLHGVQVKRNVDRSNTNTKERQDLNIWVRDRLLIAGEAKQYDEQFSEAFDEIPQKTEGIFFKYFLLFAFLLFKVVVLYLFQ